MSSLVCLNSVGVKTSALCRRKTRLTEPLQNLLIAEIGSTCSYGVVVVVASVVVVGPVPAVVVTNSDVVPVTTGVRAIGVVLAG